MSFSKPVPLDCELQRASLSPSPSPQLGQDGYSGMELSISLSPCVSLEWARVECFPSLR